MPRWWGFFLVITGATLWGLGGTVSQYVFQEFSIPVNWLVSLRLTVAGLLLLLVQAVWKDRRELVRVWTTKQTAIPLVLFGIFGMLAVQYTYMASISYGNAAVATLLQYTAPVMIIGWLLLRRQSRLTVRDAAAVMLALGGTFLLLTNGSVQALSVPVPAVIWGLLSGAALAFYTLYAVPLLKQFSALVIVSWAMVIGGTLLSFLHAPWDIPAASLPLSAWAALTFIVIFGTMIAFWFYIESLQTLQAKETSLLGSLEPLSAVAATVWWLQEPFGTYQWVGTLFIFSMIFLVAVKEEKAVPAPAAKAKKRTHTAS
ncbi:DMT family transporter [Bacillus daqingensis]|uniref:DMT family transporter n=1 Tax=Bacillus daqingensis TaxID=872396 RepID=A0ABV9NS42_9BACI